MAKKFVLLAILIALLVPWKVEAATVGVVAESEYQWTGLAISKNDRMFVCYPTWRSFPDYKVAEIINGVAKPFPNEKTAEKFKCVQSVYVDDNNDLWILDTGKPRGETSVAGSAKLYRVSLESNKIVKEYAFPQAVDLADSYMNDVRVDTKNGFAYLTDSVRGGIIVMNLNAEKPDAWRALDNIPQVKAELEGIDFVSTGFDKHQTHSDGLALSKDGAALYFMPMTSQRLYRIDTKYLQYKAMPAASRAKKLEVVTDKAVPTDGLWLKNDKIYMGDLGKEGLFVYDLKANTGKKLELEKSIHWADSFAEDSSGDIYFTTSQINYRGMPPEPYRIYRLKL